MKKRNKISINDFTFKFVGYGHYSIKYTSPVTGNSWTATINNMPLVDATKNCDNPKQKDLNHLKRICKSI